MADNFLWREFRQTFSSGSMLMRLIVVNVIVFLMLHLLDVIIFLSQGASSYIEYTFIPAYLGIPANLTSLLHRPWTIITYSFTHFNFLHILFNMLWL
jgi:membrane associated rhomboid family serine protease